MKAIVLILLFVLSLLTPIASWAQDEPKNPLAPQQAIGDTINGLAWTTTMAQDFTTHDALEFNARLNNASDQQFIFETGPKLGQPILVLTPEGKDPITVVLDHQREGFSNQSGNYKPKPGEVAHGFAVDLRLFFGALPAGNYTVEVVYPADKYEVKEFPGYKARAIHSPVIDFVIRETSLKEAQASMQSHIGPSIQTDKPVVVDEKWQVVKTGTLTNHTDQTMTFSAYTWGHQPGKPLSTTGTWEKWSPKHGWVSAGPIGWCGTGLGAYALEPGKAVTLAIDAGKPDGIYRYAIECRIEGENDLQTAYSNAILIDNTARIYVNQ